MKTYYIIYKITNTINNKIYIGAHKTNNLEDGYMGSGTVISKAKKKYGIENFEKEIIHFLDTADEMFSKEAEIVTKDFIKENTNYNVKSGGFGGYGIKSGKIVVKDENGKIFETDNYNPYYLTGKLNHITKDTVTVKDKYGNFQQVSINDERYLSGELVHTSKDMVNVRDKNGNTFRVSINDKRYLDGEFIIANKNLIRVIDKFGNKSYVYMDDPKYLSGELEYAAKYDYYLGITIDGKVLKVSPKDFRFDTGELVRYFKRKKYSKI